MKELICLIDRCLGCKTCEIACAVEHSQTKTLQSAIQEQPLPGYRLRVLCVDENGKRVRLRSVALQCRQCAEPACAEACIAGGIVKDAATHVVRFNPEHCVGCWSCLMVCPFGAILRRSDQSIAVKCDLCPGRETLACVAACPVHALVFLELEEGETLDHETEICHHRL
jgi:anaerobic carbon-monoxide dehydrogenase iron sulfur subunit